MTHSESQGRNKDLTSWVLALSGAFSWMGAALAMLARGCAHKECLSGSRGPADVKRSPRASPGLPASLSSRGETPSASAMLITRVGSGTNHPRLGLASPCPQHFASALAFSGDQTLSSLSQASFDASLHGCKAVRVGRCSNAEVISVPASEERKDLEGGCPAAPHFLPSICLCPCHLFLAFVVLYMETGTLF